MKPEQWPASKTELRSLESIKPYEKNPRTHPPEQIDLIARSMQDDGVTTPILVDENGVIIAGHGRRLAALKNEYEKYPVVVARGWSEDKKRAVRLKDNAYGLLSGWDKALIGAELAELKVAGFDMPLLGFPESQLIGWGVPSGTEGLGSAEVAPELPKHPVVRTGDLWKLGEHRLLCGDATSAKDVASLLGKDRPHLMVTDPPYGVDYDPMWRDRDLATWKKPQRRGRVPNDDRADWTEAWKLFPGTVAYVWHPDRELIALVSLESTDLLLRAKIVWVKPKLSVARGHYHYQHESLAYCVRKGETAHWQGSRTQSTVWPITLDSNTTGHGTQKPIECMKRPMENNSQPGDFVYDPFVGSGTTIIAAEMTDRKALTIEIDSGYCQVAIERWQNFTGKQAMLDGKTFAEVERARQKGGRPKPPSHSPLKVLSSDVASRQNTA